MTVQDTNDTESFSGNGVATSFPFSIKSQLSSDVKATHIDANTNRTKLVKDTDYSVTLNDDGTSTVVFPLGLSSFSTLATGETLEVRRIVPLDQLIKLDNQGPYDPKIVEKGLDKVTQMIQQIVPDMPSGAGYLIYFDSDGVAQLSITNANLQALLSNTVTASAGGIIVSASALKSIASTTLTDGEFKYLVGYYAAGDTNSIATYKWVAASTGTDDGGSILIPDDTPASGRWELQVDEAVSVLLFGAVRNGTDQTAIVQKAADFMRGAEGLGGTPTFGGTDGGYVDIPQGVQWTPVGFIFRPNVTIRQDTGQEIRTYLNGENVSGAVNEIRVISGFHPGIIREVHTDWTIDTLGSGQVLGHRISDIWNANGIDFWQLAMDASNTGDNNMTLLALNSTVQLMHWHHNGSIRYGRLAGSQDFTTPSDSHTFNKGIIHQDQEGNTLSETKQIVAVGVKDTITITAATKANPCVITSDIPHDLSTGAKIRITNVAGMVELNNLNYVVTVIDTTSFSLNGIDSTTFTTYTSGGTVGPKIIASKLFQLQPDGEYTALASDNTTFILRLRDGGSLRIDSGISPGAGVTTTQLTDISHAINTTDKDLFKMIGNSTTGRMVYASGTAASSVWKFMDGTTAHTPV